MKQHVLTLYASLRDRRTPWYAKLMLVLVVAYVLSPIDLIPDFIPVIGLLDEVILVPLALAVVYRVIPVNVREEHAQYVIDGREHRRFLIIGAAIVIGIWTLALISCLWLFGVIP